MSSPSQSISHKKSVLETKKTLNRREDSALHKELSSALKTQIFRQDHSTNDVYNTVCAGDIGGLQGGMIYHHTAWFNNNRRFVSSAHFQGFRFSDIHG